MKGKEEKTLVDKKLLLYTSKFISGNVFNEEGDILEDCFHQKVGGTHTVSQILWPDWKVVWSSQKHWPFLRSSDVVCVICSYPVVVTSSPSFTTVTSNTSLVMFWNCLR